jgi:hypothetical protein
LVVSLVTAFAWRGRRVDGGGGLVAIVARVVSCEVEVAKI